MHSGAVPSFRRIGLALLAALMAVSLAPIASGDTSEASAPSVKRPAPHKKKPARTKKKKSRPVVTTVTPRTAARLTLAAKADLGTSVESLVDDSRLPFATGGACPHPDAMVSNDTRNCNDRWEASLVELDETGEHEFSPFAVVDGHDVRAISAPGVFPRRAT